ncbi:hypothetical protein [Sphingobacterium sp. IITKGP-BTPF85]|nr:hypothetical protein [Sphingobacterium sp. IITKGP-BTPF85]
MVLYATEVAGITPLNASKYASFAGLAFMLGRFVGTFFMKFIQPLTLLMIYSIICIALSFIVIYGSGTITVYALIAVAFFMSIMFPTIFAVGVEGIGADTKSASSLIIMSIVGGAVLPPLLGLISDKTGNLQLGYWVPMICFVVVLLFSLANKNNLKTQSSHE